MLYKVLRRRSYSWNAFRKNSRSIAIAPMNLAKEKIDAVNVSIITDVWENFPDAFSQRISKGHTIAR
jgi:hypothetical protein